MVTPPRPNVVTHVHRQVDILARRQDRQAYLAAMDMMTAIGMSEQAANDRWRRAIRDAENARGAGAA